MILKIIDIKNPALRQKSRPVTKIDKKVLKLIHDMKETLRAQEDPEGVGLAACQVGKNLQIFIMNFEDIKMKVIINPSIVNIEQTVKENKTKKKEEVLEGCLSLPHYYGPIKRPQKIKIKYLTVLGKEVVEEFSGFPAQIIQHELDHLEGKLFIDHILSQSSPLYKIKGDDWEGVEL